jgi:hypothetical protein
MNMPGAHTARDLFDADVNTQDPGDGGIIIHSIETQIVEIRTGASNETRTLEAPRRSGKTLRISMIEDGGGDCTISTEDPIDVQANTSFTLDTVGDNITLVSVSKGSGGYCWSRQSHGGVSFPNGDGAGGGTLTDGDKGDIVVSGSGATFSIDTNVVTLAKMQDIATARLVGRVTAGTGDPELLTAAEVLTMISVTAGATPTNTANVDAAGAVMNTDTSTTAMQFVIDEDSFATDSATKVPTQQSVKAYVDANAGGGVVLDDIADLRALTTTPSSVFVRGHTTAWDGGGGVFDLLTGSGGTAGDMDSSGHDDNGWHIVCPTTTAVFGRRPTTVTPQQFGAIAAETETAAASASDQQAAVQRVMNFVYRPETFPGFAYRSEQVLLNFEAPEGLYRCDSPVRITIPATSPFQDANIAGTVNWRGRVWTPRTVKTPGFIINAERTPGKPQTTLRACKQKGVDAKVMWNADPWPQLYRHADAYRPWASTTTFYKNEEITQVLGSGATALYRITSAGGASGASAPTHTTGSAANGSITLAYLGTITNTSGKSCWDMLIDCDDIGIWIENCLEWQNLHLESDGYTIHVAEIPRGGPSVDQVGFVRWQGNATGCKFGFVAGSWLYDYLVANSAARLALTGLRVGAVVRQSDNASNDFQFNGPAGGESTSGNWSTITRNSGDNWCNENFIDPSFWYARLSSTYYDMDESIYGAVITAFNTTSSVPTQHIVEGISVENADFTGKEMVSALMDRGAECQFSCRNDQEQAASVVYVKHAVAALEPQRSIMRAARSGRFVNDPTYSSDQTCGRRCKVEQTPGGHEFLKMFECRSLFEDCTFSGKDKVYFNKVSLWDTTANLRPTKSAAIRLEDATNNWYFDSADLSFDLYGLGSIRFFPCCYVDLTDNHTGAAEIEVEVFHSSVPAGNASRVVVGVLDPLTGALTNFSSRPRQPVSSYEGLTATGNYFWTGGGIRPTLINAEPWVKRLVVGVLADQMTGFAVRLTGCRNGRVYSPAVEYQRGGPFIAAKPERGIYKAPCVLYYDDQTGGNRGCYLNKAPSDGTEYWATSGTVASLVGSEVAFQWAYTGTTIYERDQGNDNWVSIATSKSPVVPADWVNF